MNMIKKISLSALLVIVIVFSVMLGSCEGANFEVSDLVIEPASAMAGDTISVRIDVTNAGGSEGIYDIILKVDGEQVANELIALAGGANKTVTLNVTASEPGEHQVEIAGLSGTITVVDLDEIMEKALQAISDIHSYHFSCILEIEMSLPEDSLSLFEEFGEFEELP